MATTALAEDRSKIREAMRRKRSNQDWLDRHRQELRQRYSDRYVAVFDERVVGASEDFLGLLKKLRAVRGSTPAEAAIEYLSEEAPVWVL